MESVKAEFFYRKPLKDGEAKPAFGLSEPDPDRPDHKGFLKEVKNAREEEHSLSGSGFILLDHKSSVENFYSDKEVTEVYYDEMANLVKKQTGASQVFIVSHITRNEAEAAEGKRLGAHRLVHNDFTPNFKQTIQPLLDESNSNPSRITVFNLWRRFDEDGVDAPFALCDSRTVSEKELIPTDLFNYGKEEEKSDTHADENGFTVEIYQSMNSDEHQWYFYPKMHRDEVVMFKTYDSNEKPFMPTLHSAFDDEVNGREDASPRESIEVRAICFLRLILTEFNDPLILPSGQEIKNRFCKAAMTERVAGPDNFACERHHKIYEKWAKSGSGILLTGNVQIDRSCMEGPANVCIEEHSYQNQMPALKKWAEVSETDGSKLWMQISHAGRQTPGELNKEPLAPSSTALKIPGRNFGTPKAMTEEEILDVIKRFAFVAKIAREANFSGIQLHSAHGYLLSEFLSPDINQRRDAWGDSLENRARIHLEIIKACREAVGEDFPISMKMNSADFQKGGFSHEESIQVAKMVSDAGLDLLEISGGTYEKPSLLGYDNVGMNPKRMEKRKESTIAREAYFLEYADDIKKAISIPLMVTGGFRSRTGINAALANNACEVIGIGRPLCADPYSLQKMIDGEIDQLPDYEKTLSVGPGWLSSRSPFRLIQAINALSSQAWFYLQINKMGKGEDPDLTKRPFAAFREIAKIDSAAFKKIL